MASWLFELFAESGCLEEPSLTVGLLPKLQPSSFEKLMLTHIVIWKYRVDIEHEVREEHVGLLRALVGTIPELVSLSVGFDVLRLPRSYHTGLVAVFHDRAGLQGYTINPAHIRVAELGRSISEHVSSVDFED